MTTNHDITDLTDLEVATGILGPKVTDAVLDDGNLDVLGDEATDAHRLAAIVILAHVNRRVPGDVKRGHEVHLIAHQLDARRHGGPDMIEGECGDCGKVTYLDRFTATETPAWSGGVPGDLDYHDRCGWCGAEVEA